MFSDVYGNNDSHLFTLFFEIMIILVEFTKLPAVFCSPCCNSLAFENATVIIFRQTSRTLCLCLSVCGVVISNTTSSAVMLSQVVGESDSCCHQ